MKRFFDVLNTLEQFQKERETRKDNRWELKFVSAVFRAESRLLALTQREKLLCLAAMGV